VRHGIAFVEAGMWKKSGRAACWTHQLLGWPCLKNAVLQKDSQSMVLLVQVLSVYWKLANENCYLDFQT
jgi:hypothetical protein